MFLDQKRSHVQETMQRSEHKLFAHLLTPDLFLQAAGRNRLPHSEQHPQSIRLLLPRNDTSHLSRRPGETLNPIKLCCRWGPVKRLLRQESARLQGSTVIP